MLAAERIQNIHIYIHGKRTIRTNTLNADVSISREFRLSDDDDNNIEGTDAAPSYGRVDFLGGFNIEFF